MQRESVLNRKGQEGLTLTTLLLIVLGVVVVVVLIIGFTKGFGFIFDKFDAAPGSQLQTIAKACEIAGEQSLVLDYCARLNKVKSGEYVTCTYPSVMAGFDPKVTIDVDCKNTKDALVAACKELKPTSKNIIKIDGKPYGRSEEHTSE